VATLLKEHNLGQ